MTMERYYSSFVYVSCMCANYVTLTSSLTHHRIVNLGAHGATGTYLSNFNPSTHPMTSSYDVIMTSSYE